MPASLLPTWASAAAARLFFFLDKRRSGLVHIRDLLASSIFNDLLSLAELASGARGNPFTLCSTLSLYKRFLEADGDKDGALCAAEFASMEGAGGFTPLFVARVFEVHVTSLGRSSMDWRAFVQFHSAWTNRDDPASASYFFRILDIHERQRLSTHEVRRRVSSTEQAHNVVLACDGTDA
jgi:Ca2+-binding EF-hand superfamily protein